MMDRRAGASPRRRLSTRALLAALLTLSPAAARAQGSAPSVGAPGYWIVTMDGSTYAGELVESVVGSHVTIRLATGAIRRFESYQIRQQGPGSLSTATAAGSSGPPTTPTQATPTVPIAAESRIIVGGGIYGVGLGNPAMPIGYVGADAVRVHLQGSGQLFQESANGWQVVCAIPCATTVDPKLTYKLGGFLYQDSRTFRFPSGEPFLELSAKPVSTLHLGRSTAAVTLIAVSPVPVVLGALAMSGTFDGGSSSHADRAIDVSVGSVVIGIGIATLAIGIYALLTPPTTRLETSSGERIAGAPVPPNRLQWAGSGLVF